MYQCRMCEAKFTMLHVRKYTSYKGTEHECTNYYCPGCGGNLASSSHPSIEKLALIR